jgi:hypothetical protein
VVELLETKKQGELLEAKKRYDALHSQFLRDGVKTAKRPEDISDNWWNGSVHSLAVKLKVEDQYAFVYASQSDLVHTGSKSILQYLKTTDDGIVANCYPTPGEQLWLSVSWATGWLVGVIEVLNRAWRLNLDDEIKDAVMAIMEIARVEHEKDERGQHDERPAARPAHALTPSTRGRKSPSQTKRKKPPTKPHH